MNIEETKAAIAIMQAFVDGKKVEFLKDGEWVVIDPSIGETSSWNWHDRPYRIAPSPVIREMTADDWRKLALSGVDYWVQVCGFEPTYYRYGYPENRPTRISFDLQTWRKPEVVDGKICGRVEV